MTKPDEFLENLDRQITAELGNAQHDEHARSLTKAYGERKELVNALNTACQPFIDIAQNYVLAQSMKQAGQEGIEILNLSPEERENFLTKDPYNIRKTNEYKKTVSRIAEKISEYRMAIRDIADNRSLIANSGANRTIYAIPENIRELDVSQLMEETKIGISIRWNPFINANDGVGPMGGLSELCGCLTQSDLDKQPYEKKLHWSSTKDDVLYNEADQSFKLLTDPHEYSQRTMEREQREEAGDLGASADLKMFQLVHGRPAELAVGGPNVKDDAYFLRSWKLMDNQALSYAVSPYCFKTEVDGRELEAFTAEVKAGGKKLKNWNGREVKGLESISLSDSLRRYGVDESNQLLSDDSKNYEFCYRYPHEAMVSWNIASETVKKRYPNDPTKQQEAMIEIVIKTQKDIFTVDSRTHKIDFEACAQRMFGKSREDNMRLLAEQLQVDPNTLRTMQETAQRVHGHELAARQATTYVGTSLTYSGVAAGGGHAAAVTASRESQEKRSRTI